ncbi:caveolin-1-like [Babylonia areolata]|uniref:caveolin-1-like n=1 Tax=Babylonia areolata TaxID=304850 RepID=UPI003FD4C813
MAEQLDMVNRDPNNINDHLKVAFEDVIAEPDGVHTIDCCWKCSYRSFTWAKTFWYNVLTVCCSCPIACCWGLEFASITFDHVWHYTPCLRVFMIQCGIAQKFFGTCLQCCIGPVCETCGLFFSNIVVKNA